MPYPYDTTFAWSFPSLPVVIHQIEGGAGTLPLPALIDTGADAILIPTVHLRAIQADEIYTTRLRGHKMAKIQWSGSGRKVPSDGIIVPLGRRPLGWMRPSLTPQPLPDERVISQNHFMRKEGLMTRIKKDSLVNAPLQQVFDMTYDFENIPKWMVGMEEVRNISPGERGEGSSFEWTYNMVGAKFDGSSRIVSLDPPHRAVIKTTGGIDSTWTWTYAVEGEDTRVTCELEYTVPGATLGKIADKLVVERTNAKNLEKSLANVKALAEGG